MQRIAAMQHCGNLRGLSAFVFRDWWAARARYEYDLDQLRKGVHAGRLSSPGEEPFLPRTWKRTGQVEATQSESGAAPDTQTMDKPS
jgi:hypothetical protein